MKGSRLVRLQYLQSVDFVEKSTKPQNHCLVYSRGFPVPAKWLQNFAERNN